MAPPRCARCTSSRAMTRVLREHAFGDRLVDVIADLLATDDLKLYNDQLFMKPAHHGGAQAWHQDSQAWLNMFPMDLVTAWTAIDQATVTNGCLWMATGSHRWGMIPGQVKERVEKLLDGDWPSAALELRPGSVSFHHSLTYHRSGANHSPHRRRGYATHYMRARTWYVRSCASVPICCPSSPSAAANSPAACKRVAPPRSVGSPIWPASSQRSLVERDPGRRKLAGSAVGYDLQPGHTAELARIRGNQRQRVAHAGSPRSRGRSCRSVDRPAEVREQSAHRRARFVRLSATEGVVRERFVAADPPGRRTPPRTPRAPWVTGRAPDRGQPPGNDAPVRRPRRDCAPAASR